MMRAFLFFLLLASSSVARAQDYSVLHVSPQSVLPGANGAIEITEYYAPTPPAIQFDAADSILECELDGKKCDANEPISLKLPLEAHAPKTFVLGYRLKGQDEPKKLRFVVLGNDFPVYESRGRSGLREAVVFSPFAVTADSLQLMNRHGNLLVVNPAGGVFYYRQVNGVALDFRPHLNKKGEIYFSYLLGEKAYKVALLGKRIILNSKFEKIKEIAEPSDSHEFWMENPDHYAILRHDRTRSPLGACIFDATLDEYSHGKAVYHLRISDLFKKGLLFSNAKMVEFEGEKCIETWHFNSFQFLSDHSLLLGLFSTFVKIHQKDQKILWVLGGLNNQFELPADQSWEITHQVRYDEKTNRLLFFNNLANSKVPMSEVVELTIDQKARKVKTYKVIGADGSYSKDMSSVERTDDRHYSILFGHPEPSSPSNFVEIEDGRPVFRINFAPPNDFGYRAYRVDLGDLLSAKAD